MLEEDKLKEEIKETEQESKTAAAGDSSENSASVLMQGVTVLAVAGVISKIFGAIFRIPLTNLIGAEGQSYYGVAYPIYSLFLVIATAGFPLAISRMVSERVARKDYINAQKSFKLAFEFTLGICAISFAVLFFGAEYIADAWYKNPGAADAIKAISFALLFTSVVAPLRGYFQGLQNMKPTALTEVLEQFVRVCVGLGLAYALFKVSLEKAAAGATFGASAGLLVAGIVLLIIYQRDKSDRKERLANSVVIEESDRDRFKEMLGIIIPVTIGSSIMPIMMIIDASIVMRRLLATGWGVTEAKVLYGLISGYCDPLVNMPVVFIEAVCISLMPAITRAYTLGRKEDLNVNVKSGLKTMMIISYPCAIGLIVLAGPILHLLYPTKPEEADMAINALRIFAAGIVFLSTMRTLSSSLQGVGKMGIPVVNLGIAAICKIIISYILVGIPAININGAAFGSFMTYLIASSLNFIALKKFADVKLDLKDIFLKPMISALVMGVFAWVSYKLIFLATSSNSLATLASILIAVVIYFVMVFKTEVLTEEEMKLIPKGDVIYDIARKMRLTK